MFLRYLFTKKKISLWRAFGISLWFLLYKMGICKDVLNIRKFGFKVFSNWSKEIMNELIGGFYQDSLSLNLNPNVVDRLKNHQLQDDTVVFLSATLEEIAGYLAKMLNVKFVVATKLEFKNGIYTGRMTGEVPYGENKFKLAQEFVTKNSLAMQGSLAYGDHYSDLPLLNYVDRVVLVNPDKRLKKLAILKSWEVINN